MGIHYDFKSIKVNEIMVKQAKKYKAHPKTLDTSKPITLDFPTNPDKESTQKKKTSV